MVNIKIVHLVEIFESDTILLRDNVHAFSLFYDMWAILVLFWCLLALLFEIYDFSFVHNVIFISLVVFGKFAPVNLYFLTQCLEGVAFAGYEIVVVIELVVRVQESLCIDSLLASTMLSHKAVESFSLVVVKEFVEFNDLYQLVGVLWIGGVTTLFQSLCPAFIVALSQFKETGIAWLSSQKLAMVFIAVSGIFVNTETLTAGIVVVVLGWTSPIMAFDAEMVVTLCCQNTPTSTTLKKSLGQSDAGWNVVAKHLLDGEVLVLVDVCLVGLIPLHLRLRCGAEEQRYTYYICFYSIHSAKIIKKTDKSCFIKVFLLSLHRN